jgi:DNA-binding transcriptional LysR family regulator
MRQLRYFLAVARTLSFTRAADATRRREVASA